MGLKGTKFLQDLDIIIFLWQFQFSRPLGGEQGQTEHLTQGRVKRPRSAWSQSGRLNIKNIELTNNKRALFVMTNEKRILGCIDQ